MKYCLMVISERCMIKLVQQINLHLKLEDFLKKIFLINLKEEWEEWEEGVIIWDLKIFSIQCLEGRVRVKEAHHKEQTKLV